MLVEPLRAMPLASTSVDVSSAVQGDLICTRTGMPKRFPNECCLGIATLFTSKVKQLEVHREKTQWSTLQYPTLED